MRDDFLSEPEARSVSSSVLARLRRRTTTGRYMPEVDGLRFVCIALVVLLHVQEMSLLWSGAAAVVPPFGSWRPGGARGTSPLMSLISRGDVGVYIFFAISGFVLAMPFAAGRRDGSKPPLARYFLRRVTRIEPPYVVAMVASFVLAPLVAPAALEGLASNLGVGLLYGHALVYGTANPLNAPSWSLEIEMQFYLIVPLLALVFATADPSRRLARIAIIGLAGSVAEIALYQGVGFRVSTVLAYLSFFMAGFVLADLYVLRWAERPSRRRAWDVVSLVGWPALFVAWGSGRIGQTVAPVLIALLGVAAFRGPATNRILTNRWLATIGGMCYSIYLVHYPLLLLLSPLGRILVLGSSGLTVLVEALVMIPVVLAVSTLFFVVVERPCMNPAWPGRLLALLRRPATVLQTAIPSVDTEM